MAAKTQDRTQAKCALARAELRRQLTAHAASSFLQEPFETASFDGLTRKDAIGFDRDRSSGNVQYAADGSVAKWRQAVQDEITKAHSEKEQCYQRAESAKTAADEAASKHQQKAINEAMAKETADKAASEGEFNPQIQEFIRAAADTAKAYSDAKDAFDSVNPPGPYVKYLNAKQEYDDIVAETIGSPPVGKLEYYQNEFNAAESAAGAAYTQDRQAFEDAVRSEFVQRDTALAAQDTEQKAECSAIQEEIKIELNKVAEIVSKVSSLTMI